ncbi:MAG: flagellar biosynthesis protein FlhB [Eubacterium sp.]|nr:flagellar biosynthesis protein FlhB [Eubacterium sp.]
MPMNLQFFADDAGDKTEEPTGKKLDDARNKGQVAKSKEFTNAVELIALFVMLKVMIGSLGTNLLENFESYYGLIPDIVHDSGQGMSVVTFNYLIRNGITRLIVICIPIFIIGCAVTIAINIYQVKWKVTTEPLQPKFSKLNPISGFKRIFSMQSVMELLMSVGKILIIAIVAYTEVKNKSELLFALYDIPLFTAIVTLGTIAINMGLKISVVLLILGIIDYIYQKFKFHKDMMMTKQEVKDEYKNAEGSPDVKSKQRQRMREASRRRMMQDVPKADVIITNPTHIAVALKYTPGQDQAPVLLAKGEDYLAQKIKEIARENDIEIVENKPLARMIYMNVEIGEMIPPELYQAVADVLVYVNKFKNKIGR